jgi:butyryl-CoA dehydrogenase
MSFQLTEEQKMVKLMAREFASKELEPEAAKRDKEDRKSVV